MLLFWGTTASGPPNGVVTTANEWDGSAFSITANMATQNNLMEEQEQEHLLWF